MSFGNLTPTKSMSSGMSQRIGLTFAFALNIIPRKQPQSLGNPGPHTLPTSIQLPH